MSYHLHEYLSALQRSLDGISVSKETFQVFIAIVASLCFLSHGFIVTQSELLLTNESFLALGQARKGENMFHVHFHTVFFAGELLGALLSFIFADEFGRKTTLMYGCFVGALCNVWYALAGAGVNILTARFFVGSCFGVLLTACPLYIAEIAMAPSRGQCVGYVALNMIIGSLLAVLLFYCSQSNPLGWRLSLILPTVLLVMESVLLYFLPASPRWMLAQKTPAKCLKALHQLRRTSEVGREFNEVYRALTSDAKLGNDWQDLLQTRSILVRLVLSAVLGVSHLFVGMQLISIFGHQLFSDFGEESVIMGLLLVLLAQLLGTGVFMVYIDTLGRRVLLLGGCALMGLAWLCAAICVYIATSPELLHISLLEDHRSKLITYYAVYTTQFLFGCALCVYSFSFALSIGSVFWVYCSEIFPYRTRAKAATVTMCSYFLSSMCNTSLHHLSLAGVGIWGTYHNNDGTGTAADSAGDNVDPIIEHKQHHHRHHRSSSHASSSVYSGVYTTDSEYSDHHYSGLFDTLYNTLYKSILGSVDVNNTINTIDTESSTTRSLRHIYTSPPYIVDDDRATLFIMHLAVVSILMGLFVYFFVPETKELRLEVMEELFRLDHTGIPHPPNTLHPNGINTHTLNGHNNSNGGSSGGGPCGACSELRTLGLRTLSDQQRGLHLHPHLHHRSASKTSPAEFANYSTFQQHYLDSINHAGQVMDYPYTDTEDEIIPSSLHKYSAEMRGSHFSYIQEDEPLVPSFNLNVI